MMKVFGQESSQVTQVELTFPHAAGKEAPDWQLGRGPSLMHWEGPVQLGKELQTRSPFPNPLSRTRDMSSRKRKGTAMIL